jgi:hypothetical protein
MRRPDIITELDEQTFDLVVSVNKKEAFQKKVSKYRKSTFEKLVIPIALDYNFELHNISYISLTKYLNGDVLMQNLAFWLSSMMCEQKKSFELGVEHSNEHYVEQLIDKSNDM